jgi:hypothetical protein
MGRRGFQQRVNGNVPHQDVLRFKPGVLAFPSPDVIESKVQAVCLRGLGGPQGDTKMANSLLPPEERNLTPDQVEALDKRRDLGHTFLVIAGQFAVIATILLLWVGQDLSYSPGWAHPMAYYFALAVGIIVVFGISGIVMRRGTPRID